MAKKRKYTKDDKKNVIESVLASVGEGGLTVGQVAKRAKISKSYTWRLLQELVEAGLVYRENWKTETGYGIKYINTQLDFFKFMEEASGFDEPEYLQGQ